MQKFKLLAAGIVFFLFLIDMTAKAQSPIVAPPVSGTAPPPSGLKDLWAIPFQPLSDPEKTFAATLQGLVNQDKVRVFLQDRSVYQIIENQLRHEGVQIHQAKDVWQLAHQFRARIKGIIVYKQATPSINAATSLCGPMHAVAVEESLLPRAQALGLKVLLDVRGTTDAEIFQKYHTLFAHRLALEQDPKIAGYLRDFAVARHIYTFWSDDAAFRTRVLRALGPQTIAYGWGPNAEYGWIKDLSAANATAAPSNFALNLSAMQWLPAGKLSPPKRPLPKTEDGVRYVAFVMTDGDNIQWLCSNFVDHNLYWASPLRGSFPMTWEVSSILADCAPRVLQYLYSTAKNNESFVVGAGVPGYTYIHYQPNPAAIAQQEKWFLRASGLHVVNICNANDGTMQESLPLLKLPEVDGILYKSYSPYHRERGKIFWYHGKPCVSFRYSLWKGLMEPEDIAREVAQLPASPRTNENSYALITVHAWYDDPRGPMDAVERTVALLPPHTRIITANQMIAMLRQNFGARHP